MLAQDLQQLYQHIYLKKDPLTERSILGENSDGHGLLQRE